MTIDELKTFITLTRLKNFSKTANAMYISQSAVSARIKNMEIELGTELFIRNGSNISVTPAGQDFLNYATSIDKLFDEAICTINRDNQYLYQISISAPESHWKYALLPALSDYFTETTGISYKLISEHSWVVNRRILEGTVDLGISCQYLNHPDILCDMLYEYPYLLVCHTDLNIVNEPVSVKNITNLPLIYLNYGQQFEEWFHKNYFISMNFLETESVSTYMFLLLNKLGCGFLTKRIAAPYMKSGKLKSISYLYCDTAPRDVAYIIYPKQKQDIVSPIVQKIKNYVQSELGDFI